MVEVRAAYSKGQSKKDGKERSREDIEELLDLGGAIDIAVAYVGQQGMKIIQDKVKANSGITKVRLLVDLKGNVTDPGAVKRMVELSKKEEHRFECREYRIEEPRYAGLHAKLIIAKVGDSVTFLTGSCNLTRNALEDNKEHGVRVDCRAGSSPAKEVLDYFNELWGSPHASKITYERYREYEESYKVPQAGSGDEKYWLLKFDKRYSFKQLRKDCTDWWGTRNEITAHRVEKIKKNDKVLFYESGAKQVKGTAEVVSEPYDGPSKPEKRVDIKADEKFKDPVPLATLKGMGLKKRPSIQPVPEEQWNEIIRMGMGTGGG